MLLSCKKHKRQVRTLTILLFLCSVVHGCGVFNYEVVRSVGGRTRAGRFVTPEAYQASLKASFAEARSNYQEAADALKVALQHDREAPELQARLGFALCQLGRKHAALFAFQDALRIDPQLEQAYTARAACLLRETAEADIRQAQADLDQAIYLDALAVEPKLLRVEVDLRRHLLKDARARAEELVLVHPKEPLAYRILVRVTMLQKAFQRSLSAISDLFSVDSHESAQLLRELATSNATSGELSHHQQLVQLQGRLKYKQFRGQMSDANDSSDEYLEHKEAVVTTASPTEHMSICQWTPLRLQETASLLSDEEFLALLPTGVFHCLKEHEGSVLTTHWNLRTASSIEIYLSEHSSLSLRRLGERMSLRHKPTVNILSADISVLDRPSLALYLCVQANKNTDKTLARAMFDEAVKLAPYDPTVFRLASHWEKKHHPNTQRWTQRACQLAVTQEERTTCSESDAKK